MNSSTTLISNDLVADSKLLLKVIDNEQDFDAISDEWEQLVEHADVHIFQTFRWQRTWWKFFGGNNELQILLFYKENKLVGIMPMFLDHFRVMGFSLYRCLRMIGSRVNQPKGGSFPVELAFSDYLSIIALPEHEAEIVITLSEYLKAHEHLYDEIMLEEVPEDSLLLKSLVPRFTGAGWTTSVQDASVCPIIKLPESWDDFLMNLSSNARYQIRRFVRQATKKNLFKLHAACSTEEVTQAFDHLVEFHQSRWHKLGQPGIFMDERIHAFFKDITMQFHKKGWLFIKTVTAEGQCVAVDLLFKFKGTIYMAQRGFDDTSEYKSDSPGKVLLYTVIKEAIEDGLKAYDFLRGEEKYKFRTSTHLLQNKQVVISKHKNGPRARFNNAVRTYSHVRRKIRNERDILRVYKSRKDTASALGTYLKALYQRSVQKLKSL